jgi:hypothetical protein
MDADSRLSSAQSGSDAVTEHPCAQGDTRKAAASPGRDADAGLRLTADRTHVSLPRDRETSPGNNHSGRHCNAAEHRDCSFIAERPPTTNVLRARTTRIFRKNDRTALEVPLAKGFTLSRDIPQKSKKLRNNRRRNNRNDLWQRTYVETSRLRKNRKSTLGRSNPILKVVVRQRFMSTTLILQFPSSDREEIRFPRPWLLKNTLPSILAGHPISAETTIAPNRGKLWANSAPDDAPLRGSGPGPQPAGFHLRACNPSDVPAHSVAIAEDPLVSGDSVRKS